MELKVDQFLISSDKLQYILYEFKKPEGPLAKSEESKVLLGYYTSIEPIFHKMLERGIKESEATTLEEVIDLLRGQRLFVRKASNAIIEAIHNMPRTELPHSNPKLLDLNELIDEPVDIEPDGTKPDVVAEQPQPKVKRKKRTTTDQPPQSKVKRKELSGLSAKLKASKKK